MIFTALKINKYLSSSNQRNYKYTFILLLLMTVLQLNTLKSQTIQDDIGYFQIAFSANVFSGVYLKDATAAAKVLTEFFLKKYKRDWEVKPNEVFSNIEELKKILKKQEFEILVLPPNEYIQVKDLNLLEPIGISLRDGSPYDSYRLLARKDSDVKSLRDLNNKSVLICSLEGNKSELWIDHLLKQKKLGDKEKFFSKLEFIDKPLATILPVFFRKEDACIVEESSYHTIVELNPQIGKDLVTIELSQPLAIKLVAIRKSISDPQIKADIKEAFLNLHKYEESRQYLTVFRIGKVIEFSEEYLKSTYALMEMNKY